MLLFIPYQQRAALLHKYHEDLRHLAADNLMRILNSRLYWPNMRSDVIKFVKECSQCQKSPPRGSIQWPLNPLPPVEIFHRWGLDVIGRLPRTNRGNRYILVAVDYATKWTIARAVPDSTVEAFACFLHSEILLKFGAPVEIGSDRGA